jgi:hypothetical protein
MNVYNDIWTRAKFIEYRKLKRNGYSDQRLIEHFGDDIWYYGLYNKNSNVIALLNLFLNPTEEQQNFIKQRILKDNLNLLKDI